jgi:ATP-dependent Lon protease
MAATQVHDQPSSSAMQLPAAHREGIREVILPKDNERDLYELPVSTRADIRCHLVVDVDEALRGAIPSLPVKRATER